LTEYAKTAAFLINKAIEINKKGTHFPVWGTCLGFEIIVLTIANDTQILKNFNSSNHAMNLNFLNLNK